VSTPPEHPNQSEEELRVVVDAQIVLTMFLARRDRPGLASTKRELLGLLLSPSFVGYGLLTLLMIMNVVLMPLNQIIGSCGERNLIALDFNYFWPRSNSGRQ
jgi:hypothetical protein